LQRNGIQRRRRSLRERNAGTEQSRERRGHSNENAIY